MDSKELREMSIQNAKLAVEQYVRLYRDLNMVYGGYTSPDEIIKELRELREENEMNILDKQGIDALTKICKWIGNTYSKYGYVTILGRQLFVDEYIKLIESIIVMGQYTDKEKDMLNEVRERYIKKDLGVDNSLPF
jgi:hypothetical protein